MRITTYMGPINLAVYVTQIPNLTKIFERDELLSTLWDLRQSLLARENLTNLSKDLHLWITSTNSRLLTWL